MSTQRAIDMTSHTIKLIDQSRATLAEAHMVDHGDHYFGKLDPQSIPAALTAFLHETAETSHSQPLRAVFEDGYEAEVAEVHVMLGTSELTFRCAKPHIPTGALADQASDCNDNVRISHGGSK